MQAEYTYQTLCPNRHVHVIFDKPSNVAFSNRIKSDRYNGALAITGTIWSIPKEKLYQELGFEIMKDRR